MVYLHMRLKAMDHLPSLRMLFYSLVSLLLIYFEFLALFFLISVLLFYFFTHLHVCHLIFLFLLKLQVNFFTNGLFALL